MKGVPWLGLMAIAACGKPVVDLPPLGAAPVSPVPTRAGEDEPALPLQVALFLRGRMVVFAKNGQQTACFSDGGATCSGKVKVSGNSRALVSGDACSFTNPAGFVHLRVRSADGESLLDESVALPAAFTAIPTEIGGESGKLLLDASCSL